MEKESNDKTTNAYVENSSVKDDAAVQLFTCPIVRNRAYSVIRIMQFKA